MPTTVVLEVEVDSCCCLATVVCLAVVHLMDTMVLDSVVDALEVVEATDGDHLVDLEHHQMASAKS